MSAALKLVNPGDNSPGPLLRLYDGFLAETGSEVAAAIFAVDAYHRQTPIAGSTASRERPNAETVANELPALNPPQIAKQLRVSHDTVLDWIRRGELKASNLATGARPRYVVTPDELASFLKRREPAAPSPRRKRRRSGGSKAFRMFSE